MITTIQSYSDRQSSVPALLQSYFKTKHYQRTALKETDPKNWLIIFPTVYKYTVSKEIFNSVHTSHNTYVSLDGDPNEVTRKFTSQFFKKLESPAIHIIFTNDKIKLYHKHTIQSIKNDDYLRNSGLFTMDIAVLHLV